MPNDPDTSVQMPLGLVVKSFYAASRNLMDDLLRRHDLGRAQWTVLDLLARHGPLPQRELSSRLGGERASTSGVVAALVAKGLVIQEPVASDGRQRLVQLSQAGSHLSQSLPDPVALIEQIAFAPVSSSERETTRRVLVDAIGRLTTHLTLHEEDLR